MELWIRSQDKTTLVKAEHLDVYNASIEDEELFVIEDCGTDLGSYKSKERALEVLNEIQDILKPKYILDASSIKPDGNFYEEDGMIFQKYNANAEIKELSTFVYQMPEK